MKTLAFAAVFITFAGCSTRSEMEIREQNETRIKLNRLYGEIEQAVFDSSQDNSAWDLKTSLIRIYNMDPDLFHVDQRSEFGFVINTNETAWLGKADVADPAIIAPQPFVVNGQTNYMVIHFKGDPFLTNFSPSLNGWSYGDLVTPSSKTP